jgi:integrase/recombinase XerD
LTPDGLIDRFIASIDAKNNSKSTYRRQIKPFIEWITTSNRTRGEPLKERTISGIIKETLRRIDIDDSRITAHSLRHTAVSLSIKNGASLIQAQAMARHSDPKTTMIYFHNHECIKSGAERYVII